MARPRRLKATANSARCRVIGSGVPNKRHARQISKGLGYSLFLSFWKDWRGRVISMSRAALVSMNFRFSWWPFSVVVTDQFGGEAPRRKPEPIPRPMPTPIPYPWNTQIRENQGSRASNLSGALEPMGKERRKVVSFRFCTLLPKTVHSAKRLQTTTEDGLLPAFGLPGLLYCFPGRDESAGLSAMPGRRPFAG